MPFMSLKGQRFFFLFFLFIIIALGVIGDDAFSQSRIEQEQGYPYTSGHIPPGMEEVEVTPGHKLVVPQGAKIRQIGAQIIVEGHREYMSRRFDETDKRIQELEALVQDLEAQIKNLQSQIIDKSSEKLDFDPDNSF